MLTWTTALIAAPIAATPRLSAATYAAGSLLCHQRADRSFHVRGAQIAVCARCLGLYIGAIVGVFAWIGVAGLRTRPSARAAHLAVSPRLRTALALAAMPTVVTVGTGLLGLWDPSNLLRAALALPLGAAIAAVVAAVAAGDLR